MKKLKANCGDTYDGYVVNTFLIEDLYCSSLPVLKLKNNIKNEVVDFKNKLTNSLKTKGMQFPIIVVKASYKTLSDWMYAKLNESISGKISMTKFPFTKQESQSTQKFLWSVWGGSQRVYAAKKLGYTHIDGIILPTIESTFEQQEKMRKPYLGDLYTKSGLITEIIPDNEK